MVRQLAPHDRLLLMKRGLLGGAKEDEPPPAEGGGWAGARARWVGSGLAPAEKAAAMVAAGQLMRAGVEMLLLPSSSAAGAGAAPEPSNAPKKLFAINKRGMVEPALAAADVFADAGWLKLLRPKTN